MSGAPFIEQFKSDSVCQIAAWIDQTRYLYVQPKNKIDVLFLGSSHVHCNVNTQLLWDEYGMAAYLMTGAEQPIWNSYYNLKEALKTQKPKLVVLDMFCPSRFYDDFQRDGR